MGFETVNGVRQHYGPRDIEESEVGSTKMYGHEKELALTFAGDTYTDVSEVIPIGARIISVTIEVKEAFVLGGTTPTINLGGVAGTDSIFELSEANAEALGTYVGVLAGTYAVPLAAALTATVTLGGTSPTITSAGQAKVIIRYIDA